MASQVVQTDYIISDFLQPAVSNTNSVLNQPLYYIQPKDTCTYANSICRYILKDADCEGNEIITTIKQHNNVTTDVRIYPNPAQHSIIVEAKENIKQISLYSLTGSLVKLLRTNTVQQELFINDLANGEYILLIQSENNVVNKKLSVIR